MAAKWKTASAPATAGSSGSLRRSASRKRKPRLAAQAGEVALLDGSRVVGDEGVEADDLVADGQESFAQVRSDETGGAGDEAMHESQRSGVERAERPSIWS